MTRKTTSLGPTGHLLNKAILLKLKPYLYIKTNIERQPKCRDKK